MNSIDQAGLVRASLAASEPTGEERAAAAAMLQLIGGLHISRALYAVAELGIADGLAGGPMTAAKLARATGTHEPSLYRVLRLLASVGVLREQPPRTFSLTILGDRLRTGVPASVRSWAMLSDVVGLEAFWPIIETVRTGQSGVKISTGLKPFEHLHRDPERAARLPRHDVRADGGVRAQRGGRLRLRRAAARWPTSAAARASCWPPSCAAHPHLRGILFDLPEVAGGAAGVLEAAGVADRCDIVTGDFFQSVPSGADACVMANVLHDWDDAQSVGILARCRQAMAPGGRVLIVERLIPDDPAAAVPVLVSDINMLVVTGGKERTNAEYGELLATAGLSQGRDPAGRLALRDHRGPGAMTTGGWPLPRKRLVHYFTRRFRGSTRAPAS